MTRSLTVAACVLSALALGVLASQSRTLGFAFWLDSLELLRDYARVDVAAAFAMTWYTRRYIRPVYLGALALLRTLFGADPFGYHLVGFVLHLVTVVLLYAVARRLTGRRDVAIVVASAWVALGWNAYTVAWTAPSIPDSIAAPASLLALILFWDGLGRSVWRGTVPAVVALAVSILTKESTLTFPAVMTFIAWQHGGLRFREAVARTAPFWVLVVACMALRFVVIGGEAVPVVIDGARVPWDGSARSATLIAATLTANIVRQIAFIALPIPMIPLDGLGAAFLGVTVIVGLGLLLLAAGRARWSEPARTLALTGAVWCVVLSLPYANGSHPRVLYEAGMGFAMMLAAALVAIAAVPRATGVLPFAAIGIVAAYLGLHGLIGARVQARFAPASASTLAIYATDHRRTIGVPPRDTFDVALRDHVRTHLVAHGCLDGDRVRAHCRRPEGYDLNDILVRYRLGLVVRRLFLGDER